MSGAYIEMANL